MKTEPVFVEADVKREQIRDKAVQSIKEAFPFEGKDFSVDVENIEVQHAQVSPSDHKKAILAARTLSEPIRGTLVLRDAKGKVIQRNPKFNLLQLPYLTDHHTFVVGGNSYNVSNQLRMKPGVYTRKRRNAELEAFFNLSKGSNFHMSMDPASGQFNIKYGTSKIPLYPVLNRMGISDSQISESWNPELVESNRSASGKNADKHIDKLYEKMIHSTHRKAGEDKLQAVKRAYAETRLDPHVTKRTLGKKYDRVTPDTLLTASNKLLRAYNQKADFDERDNMAFKHLKSVDDFIGERIKLEARRLRNKVLSKLERGSKRGSLEAVPVSPFTKSVRAFLSNSALSANPTQINPMEILDQATRVTSLGEGGISQARAIPIEAQRLHSSHAGVIDPIRTPESGRVGIDLRTAIFTGRDKDGNIYTVLRDAKTNKHRYVPVEEMVDSVVAFPKQKLTGHVDVIADEKVQSMPASKVKYVFPSTHALYSPAGNLIPFHDSIDGNRQTMASKMMTQSLPLISREPPLVQVEGYKWSGKRNSVEHDFGSLMVPRAPVSGVVTGIRDGMIHIRPKRGKTAAEATKVPFYDNFPLASKTYLNHDLKVKVGDEVKAGQVLADSPFVKDGQLSLGTNLQSVSGDETIFWVNGTSTLRCKFKDIIPKNNAKAFTYSERSCGSVLQSVSTFIAHKTTEDMLEIGMWSGRKTRVTACHSLVMLDDDGKLKEIKPSEVTVKKTFIPRAVKLKFPKMENTVIKMTSRLRQTSVSLNATFGWLVGLYAAKGSVRCRQANMHKACDATSFAATNKHIRNKIVKAVSELWPDTKVNANHDHVIVVHGAALASHLVKQAGRFSAGKKLPSYIWGAPRAFREGVVAGYWDGDGTIAITSSQSLDLTASSKSMELRDQMSELLASLGIDTTLRDYVSAYNGDAYYRVRVNNRDLHKFPVHYLVHPVKKYRVQKGSEKAVKWAGTDMIPFFKNVVVPFKKYLRQKYGVIPIRLRHTYRIGYISRKSLCDILEDYSGKNKHLHQLKKIALSADIVWERITSIEKVESEDWVYDLDMGRNPNFALSNGIIVHNTAYIAIRGMNSNDAIVVSESGAQKLTSEHMFMPAEDLDADMTASRTKHKSYFGNKYTKAMYDKLDSDGVIKPGMRVGNGDLLIASIQKSKLSPEAQMLGKLHKSLVKPYRDSGLTWDREHEGTVIDVAKTGRKIRMTVKVDEPLNVGDKICYTEDTEALTKDGWKDIADITCNDVCYTLNSDDTIELHEPESTHYYPTAGKLYEMRSQQVDQRVTENHALYVKLRGRDTYELIPAHGVIGKRCRHKKDGVWEAETPEFFELPAIESLSVGKGCKTSEKAATRFGKISIKPWLRFLGAYLANGSATLITRKDRNNAQEYRAALHTIRGNPHSVSGDQHSWLKGILEECGFEYGERDDRLLLHSKQLVLYLRQFGHAVNKHVPQEIFTWGKDAAECIFEGLLGCDGHKTQSGSFGYTTISPQLADDVQRLALHVGWAANIVPYYPENERWQKVYKVHIVRSKCQPQMNHGHTHTQNAQSEEIVISDEPVYGVTVPNGTLYIRVNGKTVWSGNSGRYGNKGIVSAIIPDDQMIQTEDGEPVDVAISSSSVISRINPAQILETALAKVAKKTGKPIAVENFADRDNVKWVKDQLKKHGLKDTETVTDPTTGKKIKNILVGPQYTLKLFKSTDTNYSARGVESYDVDQQPSSGGPRGAKGVGRLVFNALLAHDARNILQESAVLKSQKNDEWWRAYQLGRPLPALKTTFAYDKFGAMLAGSGIKMDKSNDSISLGPLTDSDVLHASSGKIDSPLFVRAKDLRPERGGLFDPVATGGTTGSKWAHIDLQEPVVNPVFERPVKTLLGVSKGDFDTMIREEGGGGIRKRLAKIDLPKRERDIKKKLGNMKGISRDNAIKELKYIKTLRRNDISPDKAYITTKVPVIPPMFRPIIPGRRGDLQVNDANYLYRDAMLANDLLRKTKGLPASVQQNARKHLHDAVGALYGLKEPVSPQLKARNVKGFINRIAGTGSGPKYGFLHQKLLKRRQDTSGRATWAPDPTLGMDEVGMPEDMAWDMYRPFVTKQLVRRGYQAIDARKQIDDRTPVAKELLNQELRNRPALINRAPSLYRYNVLAAYPKMVPGKTLRVHEMLAPLQAGDFDGDAVQIHVPIGDGAVQEARRMTLPHMLLSDKEKFTLTKAAPQQEAVTGIYMATSAKPKGTKRIFKSKAEAMAAYNRGDIDLTTPVEIKK